MIKYFEAFAGIGAFRSAFEKVGGFECVGWCEIDRFAQKAYRTLYDTKGEIFYEDITKIDYGNMPDFDLLVGGPCCQSFSVAGRRLAFEDDRGNLFFNYIQILEAKRPRYFIAENVPNLLGISQGECFRIILEKISELGYSMCWRVLNSAGFGIPQSRRRLFLIGYLGDKCPSEILAFGGNDEENCEKRKPEQLIGGSQGSRVYSTDGTAVTQCSGSGGMGGEKGLFMLTECADKGDSFACFQLGQFYLKGEIVTQDLERAEKYLLLAEDNEFTQYAFGKLYLQEEKYDIQKAVDYFEKSADKNMWSSYQLGRLYLFGADELEKDKEKAVEWLTKSANDGNEYVQNMLNNIDDFENMLLRNTVMGLFVNLSRCIEDNYSQKQCSLKIQTDRKLRKMIQKRKSGIGIREEQNMTN